MDTIFAQATARGKAGVAIIRVSGPDALPACKALCGDVPPFRLASVRVLRGLAGDVLDEALVLTFAEGASYTGEASAEFHLHGGRAVCESVLSALGELPGCREAEPGEFTRRALENDRLDLAQVEGLADLIDAETEAQHRLALRTFTGEMSLRIQDWRDRLVRAMALVAATIDFADEEVPVDVTPEVRALLSGLKDDLEREIAGTDMAERVRDGFEVAIVGRPNVGKSTLLNALAGRPAALTSEVAGTTRDVIELRYDLAGIAVTFLDTAGVRVTSDRLEAAGVALAIERAEAADLRIFLVDSLDEEIGVRRSAEDILVLAQADRLVDAASPSVSGLTGQGVEDLLSAVENRLEERVAKASGLSRRRQRLALNDGAASVAIALELLDADTPVEILAEQLRTGVQAFGRLVGTIDVEDVLGEVFSSFCIGK